MTQTAAAQPTADHTGKSMPIAYLIWFFLGWAGIHRIYLEKRGSAAVWIGLLIVGVVTSFILIGLFFFIALGIWWLCDAFLVQAMVTDYNRAHGLADPGLAVVTGAPGQTDDLEQLERLHSLKEKGVLTEEEYANHKAKLNIG